MASLPKIAMTFSIGVATAQQSPIIVDPEDELLSMLQEWRQQKRGNPLTLESTSASEGTANASVRAGGCLINGKPTNPCPYGDTTQRDRRTPVILSAIQPEYPALAAASGIRCRGVPWSLSMRMAALAAVRNWIFAPGTKEGVPASTKFVIEVNFPPQI
jgi:hypothetical protein